MGLLVSPAKPLNALLLAMAIAPTAAASLPSNGFGNLTSLQACQNEAPPTVVEAARMVSTAPGPWNSKVRYGHGWNFFHGLKRLGGEPVLEGLWYTYNDSGYPIWYYLPVLAEGLPPAGGDIFNKPIFRVQWQGADFATQQGQRLLQESLPAGHLSLRRVNDRKIYAEWILNAESGQSPKSGTDCLHTTQSAAAPVIFQGSDGLWGANGWGFAVNSVGTGSPLYYAHPVFFDSRAGALGQPVWGTTHPPMSPVSSGSLVGTFQPSALTFYIRKGYPPNQTGDETNTQAIEGGTVSGTLPPAGVNGGGSLAPAISMSNLLPAFNLPAGTAIDWQWPTGDVMTRPIIPGWVQSTPSTGCNAETGETTCTVRVSWALAPGYTDALVNRVDITVPGSPTAVVVPGSTGVAQNLSGVEVTLTVGRKYRFELLSTANWVYATLARSGELNATSGTPAFPDQPFEDLADELPAHDATVGAVAGNAGVEGGSASYSIPITVPPGRAGMQPALSLSYSSQGGGGVVGVGWSLSGLSSVHRCPKTVEQDGLNSAVQYGAGDRLCLDGQRLVSSGGSGYGQSGAQYRTEVDSFARVTQLGPLEGACFRVEKKEGVVRWYGARNASCAPPHDSRILPAGAPAPLTWMLAREQDLSGNTVDYTYLASDDTPRLSEVVYTGFQATPGSRRVLLSYIERSSVPGSGVQGDTDSSYVSGGLTRQTKLLSSIRTYAPMTDAVGAQPGQHPVRQYTLRYALSASSARPLLQGVTECAGYGVGASLTCMPETTFDWQQSAGRFQLRPMPVVPGLPQSTLSANSVVETIQAGDQAEILATREPFGGGSLSNGSVGAPIGDLDGDGTQEFRASVRTGDTTFDSYIVRMNADRQIVGAHLYEPLSGVDGTFQAAASGDNGDVNNDGKRELWTSVGGMLAFQYFTGAWPQPGQPISSQFLSVPTTVNYQPAVVGGGSAGAIARFADVDGDGRVDVVISQPAGQHPFDCGRGSRALVYYRNTSQLSSQNVTNLTFDTPKLMACLGSVNIGGQQRNLFGLSRIIDLEGDGYPDFLLRAADANAVQPGADAVVRTQRAGNGAMTFNLVSLQTLGLSAIESNAESMHTVLWMDVNGDGLMDVVSRPCTSRRPNMPCPDVYADEGAPPPNSTPWRIRLNTGRPASAGNLFGGVVRASMGSCSETGISGDERCSSNYSTMSPVVSDVNGDGKDELLLASNFAVRMCTMSLTPVTPICPDPGANGGTNIDCWRWYCPEHPVTGVTVDAGNLVPAFSPVLTRAMQWSNPASEFNKALGDGSSYQMASLRFVQTGPNTFAAYDAPTGLIMGQLDSAPVDMFGDGLQDYVLRQEYLNQSQLNPPIVYSPMAAPQYNPTTYPGSNIPVDYTNATVKSALLVENTGAGSRGANLAPEQPDLLAQAIDGLTNRHMWDYFPLSSAAGRPVAPDQRPLYSIPARQSGAGYVDSRHFYFASSMSVVSEYFADNGRSGLNQYRYSYEEAMYHNQGRGFQGFRQIHVDDLTVGAELRTSTTFHQKFPLTSRVERVEVSPLLPGTGTGAVISRTEPVWRCHHTGLGSSVQRASLCPSQLSAPAAPVADVSYFPFLDSERITTFDLAAAEAGTSRELSVKRTVNAASGFASASGWDAWGNLVQHFTETWDVDNPRLGAARSAVSRVFAVDTGGWWLDKLQNEQVSSTVTWTGTHALPAGVAAPAQTVSTAYAYVADGAGNHAGCTTPAGVSPRLPGLVTRQAGQGSQEVSTSTCYTQTGLPKSVRISGPSLALVGTDNRTSTYGYGTGDLGYFPDVISNPESHVAGQVVWASTGMPSFEQDAQGRRVQRQFDPFGRTIKEQYFDPGGAQKLQPDADFRWTACANLCDGFLWVRYKVTRVQPGSPTTITYFDKFGRERGKQTRRLDEALIREDVNYDTSGRVSSILAPRTSSMSGAFTWKTYDRLGRISNQRMEPGEGDPAVSSASPQERMYRYDGLTTHIRVKPQSLSAPWGTSCPASNPEPWTCFDVTRTADSVGRWIASTDAQGLSTRFWFDGGGNPVGIQGVDGQLTTASYNASGHRLALSDPDMGSWSFTYNALGEVLTQTDARGITTSHGYDRLGRMRSRQAANVNLGPIQGVATILDTWTFDQAVAGLPDSLERRLSGVAVWSKSFSYDAGRRPERVTVVPGNDAAQVTRIQYHGQYGWEKGRVYPSGLRVAKHYSKYGHLTQVGDGDGQNWYEVAAHDVFAQPYQENFGNGVVQLTGRHRGSAQVWGIEVQTPIQGQPRSPIQTFDPDLGGFPQAPSGRIVADRWNYRYDALSNVTSQERIFDGQGRMETFAYDARQRLISASRSGQAVVSYAYGNNGNIQSKGDYGFGYVYGSGNAPGAGNAGPRAVTQVSLNGGGLATFAYDDNGNVVGGNTITAAYDHNNMAWYASRAGAGSDRFAYGPDGQRYWHQDSAGMETWYGEGGYEKIRRNGVLEHRHHLPGAIITIGAAATQVTYIHKDRLGSTIVLTGEDGQILTDGSPGGLRRSYDPFGGARRGDMVDRPNGTLGLEPRQNRGFTGHEHLDASRLIHMNGRIYDHRLGRFLGVDPIIQFPANSQSLNPYSYLMNNPMSGTDPTGYSGCGDTAVKEGASCNTERTYKELGSNIIRREMATVTGLGKDSAGNISAAVSFNSGRASLGGVVGSANGARMGSSVIPSGIADGGREGSRGPASGAIGASSAQSDLAGSRKGRAGSQELRSPTRGERNRYMQTLEAERSTLIERLNLLTAVSVLTGDLQSARDFAQSSERFGKASVVDKMDQYHARHAEMLFINTDFRGGEPTSWSLEVYRGAWDAFKRGSPAAGVYSVDVRSGLVGLRTLLAHESGHAVSRLNFFLNRNGGVEPLPRKVMERNADEWARTIWPN